MEPQHPRPSRPNHHPHLLNLLPITPGSSPSSPLPSSHRPSNITPASSPGVFSPATSSPHAIASAVPLPDSTNPTPPGPSHTNSYTLPHQPVRETHTANVDRDFATGRKTINEYQVLEEIGRGQHGKVKLARDSLNGHLVAIKIIPRLSKTRRLGKVSAVDPQQNTKREIAILKKIRHENVVALLEVIDDPELQKIYMVLEHVERGEITWRKKGLPNICYFERYRIEKGMHGEELAPGEYNWHAVLDRKATIRALKEARAKGLPPPVNQWTTEFGVTADDDDQPPWWYVPDTGSGAHAILAQSPAISRVTSRAPSRVPSATSVTSGPAPQSYGSEASPLSVMAQDGDSGSETPGLLRPSHLSSTALDGTMFGAYVDESVRLRQRSPSVADSIISHTSGIDYNAMVHDPYADDFSYVPCFSIEQARNAFRDTVLGLEYLHYHGVVHRDIKPANLLWTKDFRVKISDFGVSYFGRPIRDGEPDGSVSESEALDFDDDRELSKTVGTPAFFAPELCYTDIDKEPPRVSEQIDVWSLGVTLYCLIFARIPFLAEDEFSMFRKIATEDAFISHRRLKPVGIFTDPTGSSLYQRTNVHPYRSDAEPEYEELSDSLLDLLGKMLTKNPEKRIRLRDVKRHKWVTEDIDNVVAWLDSTDPARSQDRRIQVDDAEIGEAVVPLNFLQRARSAVKRAVDKVMHPRPERDESTAASSSRRRAASSVASSTGDASPAHLSGTGVPPTLHHNNSTGSTNDHGHGHSHSYSQGHNHGFHNHLSFHHHTSNHPRDARRQSLRGDDYFATVTQMPTEHPLSQSVTASPYDSPGESTPNSDSAQQLMSAGEPSARPLPEMPGALGVVSDVDGSGDANTATVSKPMTRHHAHSRSVTNAILSRGSLFREAHTVPTTPAAVDTSTMTTVRRARDVRSSTDPNSRTRSVDRAGIVFANPDKRAGPVVGLSAESVPGSVHQPLKHLREVPSINLGRSESGSGENIVTAGGATADTAAHEASGPPSVPLPSPQFFSSTAISAYRDSQPTAEASVRDEQKAIVQLDERPATAHRVPDLTVDTAGSSSGICRASDGFTTGLQTENHQPATDPANIPCPPSPRNFVSGHDDGQEQCDSNNVENVPQSRTRRSTTDLTATSSSSASLEAFSHTPLTSPSEVTQQSFVASHSSPCKDNSSNAMMTFHSDPSLPALLSGASSVSADIEGDFLGIPGVVDGTALVDASESLTPPALEKETGSFPLDHNQEGGLREQQEWGSGGAIPVELDNTSARTPIATPVRGNTHSYPDDDEEDSDSDGGIVMMAKTKKKGGSVSRDTTPVAHSGRAELARRRDTNTSIASTDTAKKVSVECDN